MWYKNPEEGYEVMLSAQLCSNHGKYSRRSLSHKVDCNQATILIQKNIYKQAIEDVIVLPKIKVIRIRHAT